MHAIKTIVSVMLMLLVIGCVNYDERIELNTDGSGVIRMHLSISEQMLHTRGKSKIKKESDLLPMPRKELIADIEKEGFKVRSLRVESSHGHRHFYLVLEFKNLETLAKSQLFGKRKASLKRDGPRWQFRQEINVSEKTLTDRTAPRKTGETTPQGKSEKKSDQTESILKQLERQFGKARVRQMLGDYSVRFSLRLNGAGLIRHNGRSHRDTTAIWEIALDQLIEKKPTLQMEADFAMVEPAPRQARGPEHVERARPESKP